MLIADSRSVWTAPLADPVGGFGRLAVSSVSAPDAFFAPVYNVAVATASSND